MCLPASVWTNAMHRKPCHSEDMPHDLLQHLSRLQSIPLPGMRRLLRLSITRQLCLEQHPWLKLEGFCPGSWCAVNASIHACTAGSGAHAQFHDSVQVLGVCFTRRSMLGLPFCAAAVDKGTDKQAVTCLLRRTSLLPWLLFPDLLADIPSC